MESGVGIDPRVPIRNARILPLGHAAKAGKKYHTSRNRTGRELVSDHMVHPCDPLRFRLAWVTDASVAVVLDWTFDAVC